MRIFRRHPERPELIPEAQWTNPFGDVAIETNKILASLSITMLSGELVTATIKTAEALHPIIVRKVAFDALAHWLVDTRRDSCDAVARVQEFVDTLVPAEAIAQAEEATEAHSQKLRHSLHLLEANNNDYDQAVKAGIEIISQSVQDTYTDACTPEIQAKLGHEFESWVVTN